MCTECALCLHLGGCKNDNYSNYAEIHNTHNGIGVKFLTTRTVILQSFFSRVCSLQPGDMVFMSHFFAHLGYVMWQKKLC